MSITSRILRCVVFATIAVALAADHARGARHGSIGQPISAATDSTSSDTAIRSDKPYNWRDHVDFARTLITVDVPKIVMFSMLNVSFHSSVSPDVVLGGYGQVLAGRRDQKGYGLQIEALYSFQEPAFRNPFVGLSVSFNHLDYVPRRSFLVSEDGGPRRVENPVGLSGFVGLHLHMERLFGITSMMRIGASWHPNPTEFPMTGMYATAGFSVHASYRLGFAF